MLGLVGCGEEPARRGDGDAGAAADAAGLDLGELTRDAAADVDAGATADGALPGDGAVPSDGGAARPEVCDSGTDEDADGRIDCADDDCWSGVDCAAVHVATLTPGLTACHDPVLRSVADEDAACPAVGTPLGSEYPTVCAGEVDVSATIRFFCDADSDVRAVWINEIAVLPQRNVMLGARRFERTYYEHSFVLDYERTRMGAASFSRMGPSPLYEARTTDGVAIVTVRTVEPGASIERLLGLARIVSIVDLDLPMSMDTRSNLRVGATQFTVP